MNGFVKFPPMPVQSGGVGQETREYVEDCTVSLLDTMFESDRAEEGSPDSERCRTRVLDRVMDCYRALCAVMDVEYDEGEVIDAYSRLLERMSEGGFALRTPGCPDDCVVELTRPFSEDVSQFFVDKGMGLWQNDVEVLESHGFRFFAVTAEGKFNPDNDDLVVMCRVGPLSVECVVENDPRPRIYGPDGNRIPFDFEGMDLRDMVLYAQGVAETVFGWMKE